ncbi:oxidoreductase [Macrococcus hajekii]|uniref:2-dehydropantoate 2-reductase n=1 Tax=Macrococcus hajekii TaxID=198482 RepID=A0A4R6BMN4_9STAP|nr:oxidoreductase [Macrococcus hajekii]TDM03104.1 oxidoreductase [Macrococcus hajekii]GGA95993.1 2-dehydropantoate 2-reductase [Macrococcus hajekii]
MTNFAVIGPGAVGSVIALELLKAGLDVKLFGRQEQQVVVKQTKLNVTSLVVNQQKFDYIFIAIKVTKNHEITEALRKMTHHHTIIIVCQNGMGQLTDFNMAAAFQAAVYISGQKKGDVVTHFRDQTLILPDYPAMHDLKKHLSQSTIEIVISEGQRTILWYKMLVNLGINTVTALSKNTTAIMELENIQQLVRNLLHEGVQIANADGENFSEATIDEIMEIYKGYPADMGTSMYYDALNDRKLEYDFIQGQFHQIARENHIDTPVLDICCTLLTAYQYKK